MFETWNEIYKLQLLQLTYTGLRMKFQIQNGYVL
jgi:hypothetical protein